MFTPDTHFADELLELTALDTEPKMIKREAAFYGFCAGVLACTASTPFRRAAFSVSSLLSIPAFLRDTTRADGLLGLWRGNSAACLMIAPKCALRYAVYKTSISTDTSDVGRILAGAAASTIAELATFPFTVIKNRQRAGDGLFKTFSDIVNKEGFHALGDGALRNALVTLPVDLVHQVTFREISRRLGNGSALRNLGCISLSTMIATTLTFPFEVVKRGVNSRNENGGAVFRSIGECCAHIARERGVSGFYEGLGRTIFARIPFVAAEITFLQGVQSTLRHIHQLRVARAVERINEEKKRQEEEKQRAKVQPIRSWSWF